LATSPCFSLSTTNSKQSEFYLSIQPSLLGEFQQFEEDRLAYMKSIVEKFSDLNSERPAIYQAACDFISNAAHAIDVDSDISSFVSDNRTGVTAPADIPYTTYDSEVPSAPKPSGSRPNVPGSNGKKFAPPASKDILSSKEWGLSSSDHNLPVNDQKNKLNTQLEELDKAIVSETKSKEGLENLVRFYASDPVAQKKAEDEINECESKLTRLQDTRSTVAGQLDNLGGSSSSSSFSSSSSSNQKAVRARGVYDYAATCDTELSFKQGDMLQITEQDESGWWYAELNGKSGFVPKNYVKIV